MKKIVLILVIVCLVAGNVSALDLTNLRAYPVPVNPRQGEEITIAATDLSDATRIDVTIYDVNGDKVFSRTYTSGTSVTWNCRNSRGKIVKPGLYIIKIVVEGDDAGEYGKKILRILVKG